MEQDPLSILVTGAAGFIGQHVVGHLAGLGHRVTALDFRQPAHPWPEGVDFVWCDLRSGCPPNRPFGAIVHLAALAGLALANIEGAILGTALYEQELILADLIRICQGE